ncbi:iron-containing alcohol dehydrogenase family protein [Amphibacillus sediminis]|uniref:iron-containing alcohol dehydrogenase family protein n=1 Tax=Amphibacillus sediminis TaxID=360185 RepID=UPI0008320BA4|nr:iron-containing alcohol dehydrogenase family protein [Amphibacillus sediminis]
MEAVLVQGAPTSYRCHQGALFELKTIIEKEGWGKGLLVHGQQSWRVAEPFINPLQLKLVKVRYQGECSRAEVERITELARREQVDYILGVGGGKVIDLAKASANHLKQPFLIVPTLASNCAAWTPLSVFYDQNGTFTDYQVFNRNAFMVAIEPELILDSPSSYLRAGIGDTIAKWYEADVLARQLEDKGIAIEISLHAAKLCRDVLLMQGAEALNDQQHRRVSPAFLRVIETIIMAGGMVGGFGDRYGRIAGAHSIHNGLTALSETHRHLHGNKVAYGILVQLVLEDRLDEVNTLLPYYRQLKLPTSLKELGVTSQLDQAYQLVAQAATKPGESIHLIKPTSSAEVASAMEQLTNWLDNQVKK